MLAALALTAFAPNLQAQSARALQVLHERLLPVFEVAGVVFTYADESKGRLVVGVMDRDMEGAVRERLPVLGIASRLVDVVETEPIVQLTTLRDKVRPVVGGLQIRFSGYLCTVGFPAVRGGQLGFVTASHCSTKQGSVDGTKYYQPLDQVADQFIGAEIADPQYFKGGACPRGRQCRYSDSNFSRAANAGDFDLGKIAETDGVNNGSLTIGNGGFARFTITGTGSPITTGIAVSKVGRTTGWTQGTVTAKCANVAVSGTNIVNLCQDIVESTSVIVGSGDSGSPVFVQDSGDNVTLAGLLWGGNSSGTLFVYSPIENIQKELGALTVK